MIYLSKEEDPFINLAIEQKLLLDVNPNQKILFFYRNKPCIVMGRFQNPWVECHLEVLKKRGVSLVRRQSGGGTVYHDLGNLNYSFIRGNKDHENKVNLQFLVNVLKSFNIEAFFTDRSDLRVIDENISKKISGAAFKQKKDRSIHHGTLLFSSRLNDLNGLLKTSFKIKEAKGIKSVPSVVLNLSSININITQDDFIKKSKDIWNDTYQIQDEIKLLDRSYIDKEHYNLLISWDWIYGETPKFQYEVQSQMGEFLFEVHKGVIKNCDYDCSELGYISKFIRECFINQKVNQSSIEEIKTKFEEMEINLNHLDGVLASGVFCAD